MAYTKLRDMLDLALELQGSSLGLTIDQLMNRSGRSPQDGGADAAGTGRNRIGS